MANPLFNMFGNSGRNNINRQNISNQYKQLLNNPGQILDILLQNGKINRQQYNDLQVYRNNPEQIVRYLVNNGNATQINQSQQIANQLK